jgi:hypothetical protein
MEKEGKGRTRKEKERKGRKGRERKYYWVLLLCFGEVEIARYDNGRSLMKWTQSLANRLGTEKANRVLTSALSSRGVKGLAHVLEGGERVHRGPAYDEDPDEEMSVASGQTGQSARASSSDGSWTEVGKKRSQADSDDDEAL